MVVASFAVGVVIFVAAIIDVAFAVIEVIVVA